MATVNKVTIEPSPPDFHDYLELEILGVEPAKRCQRCKSCKACSDEGLMLSCQEEDELKIIEEGVRLTSSTHLLKILPLLLITEFR